MSRIIFDFDTVTRKPKIISEYLDSIREHFSIEDKAMAFIRRRVGRGVPTRKYAITNKGHFDLPFFEVICNEIKKTFPNLNIETTETFNEFNKTKSLSDNLIKLNLEPRDYQKESAEKALKNGNGIIVLPTSAGKTFTMALIAATSLKEKQYKVFIIVPNIQLVHQTYQDFLDYGISDESVSKWTGNHEFEGTDIVISNSQILLSQKQDISVLNNYECMIVDECHKISTASEITKLIKKLNKKHIFGLTGSLPESNFDIWSLNRIFGSIVYCKKSIELRQENYISKVRVVALELSYKNIPKFTTPSMSEPTAGYEEETTWLHSNEYRNSIISKLISRLETNTLILVDRIVHGELLLNYLKTNVTNRQIYFVQGSVEVEEREKIRTLMENEQGIVCIAISKIFSTGISIKNLHNIIFAAIGKARIKIIQSIGRSLRLHHTKQIATIFDIADVCLNYGFKHFEERKRLYESEKIPLTISKLTEF